MRLGARLLLTALPLSLVTCLSGVESVCHQAAVQRLGCCPMCDDGCGQDRETLRKVEACVDALELVDEEDADGVDDVEDADDVDDEEPTPDGEDRPDAPFE